MDDVLSYIGRQGVFCGDFSAERISAGASGSAVYAVADRCGKYILKASQDTGGKDAHQSSPFAREYAFHTLGAEEVCSIIRDTNTASQQVALRCGMTRSDSWVKHYRDIDMSHYRYVIRRK